MPFKTHFFCIWNPISELLSLLFFRKIIFPTKNPLATQPVCCSSGEKMCQLATLCWPQMKTPHIEEDQTPFHNLIVQVSQNIVSRGFSHISVRFLLKVSFRQVYNTFSILLIMGCRKPPKLISWLNSLNLNSIYPWLQI